MFVGGPSLTNACPFVDSPPTVCRAVMLNVMIWNFEPSECKMLKTVLGWHLYKIRVRFSIPGQKKLFWPCGRYLCCFVYKISSVKRNKTLNIQQQNAQATAQSGLSIPATDELIQTGSATRHLERSGNYIVLTCVLQTEAPVHLTLLPWLCLTKI